MNATGTPINSELIPSHVVALRLLRADAPGEITGAPENWPRWAVLLPHVLAAVNHAPASNVGPGQVVETVAWLLDRAGSYLQVHGRAGEARPLLERALTITETVHGPNHPTTATTLNNLALVLQDLGEPATARRLLEGARDIAQAASQPEPGDPRGMGGPAR